MIKFRPNNISDTQIHKYQNFENLFSAYRYRKAAERENKIFKRVWTYVFLCTLIFSLVAVYKVSHWQIYLKEKQTHLIPKIENGKFEQTQMAGAQYSSFDLECEKGAVIRLLSGVSVYVPPYAFTYMNDMRVEGKVELLFVQYEADVLSYEIYAFSNEIPIKIKEKIVVVDGKSDEKTQE